MIAFSSCVLFAAASAQAVSVVEFGAVGDGITDDSPAITEALNALVAPDQELYFPPGTYLLASNVVIDRPVCFVGSGHETSVFTSLNGEAGFYLQSSGIEIRDLGFEEMIEPIALVTSETTALENVWIERCRFERIATRHRNRGTIGLSSGNSNQQLHAIRKLVVADSVFRDIDARAINIRGRISGSQILDNVFENIANDRDETAPDHELGGYAIRLGTDETGEPNNFEAQGGHLIDGNRIVGMRKRTAFGNLMAILCYGNSSVIRGNFIADIDGLPIGDDSIAIYIRGGYNHIIENEIRNIRGSDDDGAISFKEASEINYGNTVAYNIIENIYGMAAVEASSSALQFYGNTIRNAPMDGFVQRAGESALIADNIFHSADTDIRTQWGIVYVFNNTYINSRIRLSQRRSDPSDRVATYIHGNEFIIEAGGFGIPVIRLANGVAERFVSVRGNRLENASYQPASGHLVDLATGGQVGRVEVTGNTVIQNGPEPTVFRVSSREELVAENDIRFGVYPDGPPPAIPADLRLNANGDERTLAWTAEERHDYRLQYSNDLRDWFDTGETIEGTGGRIELNNLPAPWDRPTFYRLLIRHRDAMEL